MTKFLPALFLFAGFLNASAEKYPFQVFNPSETKIQAEDHQVYPWVKTLISQLRGGKRPEFIKKGGQGHLLRWSIETVTIVSPDLVAVGFTEGHLEVIGVFQRDHEERHWDLVAEVGGTFSVRKFPDPDEPKIP